MGCERGDGWTKERDGVLRSMVRDDMSTRAIAKALNLHQTQVVRRIAKLGLREPQVEETKTAAPHIERYRSARRGFHVPAHLEDSYYELLKTGVPIAEACRRLGIEK